MEDSGRHKGDTASQDSEKDGVRELLKGEAGTKTERYFYRQDVVRCNDPEGSLGVVLEVPGESDSEGSVTDDSDIEDDESDNAAESDLGNEVKGVGDGTNDVGDSADKKDALSDGEVRVMWLDGTETTNNLSDLVVMDRSFLHGDIVASAENPSGQLGLVVDVHITVDLLSPTGKLIKGVSSLELMRIRKFAIGDYVVHGPWLGRVEDVLDNVTVLFDDGSVCKVLKADPLRLKPVSKSIVDDTGFPYYPGQRVRASSSSVFKNCRFVSGSWKANRLEGTITKVEAGSVYVYWTSSSSLGTGANPATVPPEQQNPKNLTLVSCFAHSNWQLGDWCLFCPESVAFSDNASRIVECSVGKFNLNGNISNNVVAELSDNITENSALKMVCNPDIHVQKCDHQVFSPLEEQEVDEIQNPRSNCLDSHTCITDSLVEEKHNQTEVGNCASGQKESIRESRPVHRKKLRKVVVKREHKGSRKDDSFEKAFLVANTVTKVDVVWQDGTREFGLNSTSLNPINSPGEQDFFPEQYVIEKASSDCDDSSEVKRVGVVKSVNATERTACIRWLKPVQRPEDMRLFDNEEVVSVYELDEHPDYDYCYGDVVIRLAPMEISDPIGLPGNSLEGKDLMVHCEANDSNSRDNELNLEAQSDDHTENVMDMSWVGHITGLQDGDIEVSWADGMISKVGPQAIFVVGRDDDESFDGGSEYSNGASWETVEENDMDPVVIPEGESDLVLEANNAVGNVCEASEVDKHDDDVAKNGPLSSAFGFVARLASGLFSRGRSQSEEEDDKVGLLEQETSGVTVEVSSPDCDNATSQMFDHGSQTCDASIAKECNLISGAIGAELTMPNSFQEHTVVASTGVVQENGDCFPFHHFDVTNDPLDHYFLGGTGQVTGERKWVKKVQQEWAILEKNLPDAIYVRVFEDRMDLLRVAIIGACGTPYQDGLFFFDFQLPPEYPDGPPKAYYHSGGLRVNPNLYEDGKVCLSLLNTWTGKGNEVWDPSSSSVLQVLVSIQGLVLNSKPYFNEAGYEKQIGTVEGEKNSLPYNENTFLLNLKSMMYVLRRPPMHFEEFVRFHFRRRGHYILKACDAYMKGSVVGSLTKDADMTKESYKHSCSVGFKLMLAKILPRLFTALKEVGAECRQFEHLLVT